MTDSSSNSARVVGYQLTLLGVACFQLVDLLQAFAALFLAGIALIVIGTIAVFASL